MTYRILVTTDFSPASDYAVRYALAMLGRTTGAELHLGHIVVDTARHGRLARDERLLGDAQTRLRAVVTEASAARGGEATQERPVVVHVRLAERAADGIEQLALDVGADVVVVGSRQRSALVSLVLGSVAEELLRRARVPMLVARPSSYVGMERTASIDAPKPGADLHEPRHDISASTDRVTWVTSSSHIAGLL
ncbi:MAG: universal stress protein [Deltaproteobacteria bacterium]|nr:universal stress protein [Deltaproteobacteria bacterium]